MGIRHLPLVSSVSCACVVVLLGGCTATGERRGGEVESALPSPETALESVTIIPPDRDHDSIPDAVDDCPSSGPEPIVDQSGCELFDRVLSDVVFAPGDYRLGAEARLALMALVVELDSYPGVVLQLEGHTDNRGNAAGNLDLSKRRVMSVARFLVANGIAPERLKPYGYGESRPLASNATPSGRGRNRRIVIERVRDVGPLAEPGAARQNAVNPGSEP